MNCCGRANGKQGMADRHGHVAAGGNNILGKPKYLFGRWECLSPMREY
jgi:hypothetical protein